MGSCATDKSDMPGRGVNLDLSHQSTLSEAQMLKQSIDVLTKDNNNLRSQLGNLDARYKKEVELTTAYRRVIKDLSEDI